MGDVALLFDELALLRQVSRTEGRFRMDQGPEEPLTALLQFQFVARSGSKIQPTPRGILALIATESVSAVRPALIRSAQLKLP